MKTIKITLDAKLLEEIDGAVVRAKQNRSSFIRAALCEHLRRLEVRALEELDREGYARHPQSADEELVWDEGTAWLG